MDSKVKGLMGDSFENLRTLIDVNSIIGDPINTQDGTVIIPVSKVTFGYGMGGSDPAHQQAGGLWRGHRRRRDHPAHRLPHRQGRQCAAGAAGRGENNTAERAMNMVPDVVDKISGIIADRQGKKKPAKAPEHPEG